MVQIEEIIAQRAYAVSRLTPSMMIANILNALTLLLVLRLDDQMRLDALIWAGVLILFALISIGYWFSRRRNAFPSRVSQRTHNRATVHATLLGCLWAYPGLMILPEVSGMSEAFIVALSAGIVAGGAIVLFPMPSAAFGFCGVIVVGSLAGFFRTGDQTFVGFVIISLVFLLIVFEGVRRHDRVFVSEFKSRRTLDVQNRVIGKLLEQARAETMEERLRSERRLVLAQKLEAIGQLTGGIAHDFNNLLAAIQGHAELLAMDPNTDRDLIEPILRSTRRGSDLTQRLLAFARRQTLKPQVVDLPELVRDTAELLQRTLREDITIETSFAPDLWSAMVDPNLLGNALLNLATNSRDAMPNGGRILISVTNVKAGDIVYGEETLGDQTLGDSVLLTVKDTGTGMSDETRQRAVDPFFTTKEFGTGSGLGLSMVYGFVEQSDGRMKIDSEVGKGTEISIWLPRAEGVRKAPRIEPGAMVPEGDGATVLIIEDDEEVRNTASRLLKSLGYLVRCVSSVDEARQHLSGVSTPDVILSDVILPGGTWGIQLAREVRASHPGVGILLMSGYTNVEAAHQTVKDLEIELLTKPFDRATLARAVYASRHRIVAD